MNDGNLENRVLRGESGRSAREDFLRFALPLRGGPAGVHPLRSLFLTLGLLLIPLQAALAQEPPADSPRASSSTEDPAATQEVIIEQRSAWFGSPNIGYGPYHQVPLGFFNSLRLGFIPRAPEYLPEGAWEARVTESWAKVISEKDKTFDLDYEVLRSEAGIAYGLTNETFLSLNFDTASRVHGILDPFMNAFHNTFGIPLGPRGRLPNNSFRVELNPGQGRPPISLDDDAGRPFTRSIVLSTQHTITYGDEWMPAISLSGSLRPPLGHFEPLEGGSPIDLSASIGASKSFGDFYLYLAASYSLFGDETYAGTPLKSYQWGVLGALEWHVLENFSLVVQCLSTSGLVPSFEPFNQPAYELCCGFKWEVARDFRIDFALLHDVVDPINAPDFGFQLEFSLRW